MVSESTLSSLKSGGRGSMNLSFAGCGFLGIYHVGVCSCLRRYAGHISADSIAGASAGALAACAFITGVGLGETTNYVLDVALQARSRALGPLHPSFNIVQAVREGLERFLPDNAYQICSGKLRISLTRVSDRKNVLVSEFDSNQDLVEALLCSTFIPFYSGVLPPKYKGVRYVDGGLSDNIPILDENTISVSPFAGESDICPDDNSSSWLSVSLANTNIQLNTANLYRFAHALFPPSPEELSSMCQRGFEDTLKFLHKNGLINCARHLRIESAITPVSSSTVNLPPVGSEQPLYIDTQPVSETESDDSDYYNYDKMQVRFENEDEEEEEEDYLDSCDECRHHQSNALTDSRLPHSVVSALEAGIDSVNTGILASVYNLRAFRLVSLLTAPWFLPLDVSVVLAKKFVDWAPYLPSDMQKFIHEFRHILRDLYDVIQKGRHRYSARFTCQLAITETGIDPSRPSSPRGRRRRHSSKPHQHHSNVVGFSVDFHTHQKSPLKCVGDLRQQILEDEHHHSHVHLTPMSSDEQPSTSSGYGSPILHHEAAAKAAANDDANYDTFENCLHITNQMDALLAYYYAEEDDPSVIKVAEIYALDDPRGPSSEMNTSDLVWDNFVELKRETPPIRRSATSFFPVTSAANTR